jgi:uncharacterized Zn-finger protein
MITLGTCPVCHLRYTLTDNGTLPVHLDENVSGRKSPLHCEGAGRPPATSTTEK